jgi:hypothetical protein
MDAPRDPKTRVELESHLVVSLWHLIDAGRICSEIKTKAIDPIVN